MIGSAHRLVHDRHGRRGRRHAARARRAHRDGHGRRPRTSPTMKVGFAGDIPNAAAEKESVVSAGRLGERARVRRHRRRRRLVLPVASGRSSVIALPALLGVGAAYAFAYFRFGYVNTTGMFLGAIILGNGINYPIVLLSRYREFRARGQEPAEARREAVQNALRAELVGACVASIAYGSLTVTRLPRLQPVRLDRLRRDAPRLGLDDPVRAGAHRHHRVDPVEASGWLRDPPPTHPAGRRPGTVVSRGIARATRARAAGRSWSRRGGRHGRRRAGRCPAFLRDPWEYDFDRLGSRGSKQQRGRGVVEQGRAGLRRQDERGRRADARGQRRAGAPARRRKSSRTTRRTRRDVSSPKWPPSTISCPARADEQKAKLEVLDRIRDRLTPAVLDDLPGGRARRASRN